MRKDKIQTGRIYHIVGRGVHKNNIFHEQFDWYRFMLSIMKFQYNDLNKVQISMTTITKNFFTYSKIPFESSDADGNFFEKFVSIGVFCLMNNHYHITIRCDVEGGLSKYMQRLLTSHAQFYNNKYAKSGHLFEAAYRAHHIKDERQYNTIVNYIHNNPKDLEGWKENCHLFPFSTLMDSLGDNRWGKHLDLNLWKNTVETFQ